LPGLETRRPLPYRAPADPYRITAHLEQTNVLEIRLDSRSGVLTLTDVFPNRKGSPADDPASVHA
jgi:hypothetical protein